jgi:uncharacterized membrane protein YeaQ/YmgE (transglycosylase-associated protein family)
MGLLWIILIGFVAGLIARVLAPGPNKPSGFLLTTVRGIAGAFLATFGQSLGWYRLDQGAGFIGATVGAGPSAKQSLLHCILGHRWWRLRASRNVCTERRRL